MNIHTKTIASDDADEFHAKGLRLVAAGSFGLDGPTAFSEDCGVLQVYQQLSSAAEFARRAHIYGDYDELHLECIGSAFADSAEVTSVAYVDAFLKKHPDICKHFVMADLLPVQYGGNPA